MAEAAPRSASNSLVKTGLALALISVLVPIVAFPIPPLTDFPNHFARFWLISGGAGLAPVSGMYAIDWSQASTNVGLDLLVKILAPALSLPAVVKLIVILTVAGPPAAAALLNGLVFRRVHWWQIGFGFLAWTTTALAGFLSYQVALAMALGAACLELGLHDRPLSGVAARVVCGALILATHPFGLAFYGALLLALAIGPVWPGLSPPFLKRVVLMMGPPIVTALAFWLVAPTPPGAHAQSATGLIGWAPFSLPGALLALASPVITYDRAIDMGFMAAWAALCIWSLRQGRMRSHVGLILVGLLLAAAALAMPSNLGDASWLDRRLPLMAMLTLAAGIELGLPPRPVGTALTILAAALVIGKSAWITILWAERSHDIAAVERALAPIPAGAAVLAAQVIPTRPEAAPKGRYLMGGRPDRLTASLRHMPDLAVPERRAFIPTLFAIPGQQPLKVLPPWSQIALARSAVPDVEMLGAPLTEEDLRYFPYVRDWRRRFDYLVVVGADQATVHGPYRAPQGLRLISDQGFAQTYRIR